MSDKPTNTLKTIKKGHLYRVHSRNCIALQDGIIVKFLKLKAKPNIADVPEFMTAHMNDAVPLGMKYYGGDIPP